MENVGFNVNEEVVIGDLSDVKETRTLVPPAKDVKLEIKKAELLTENKDGEEMNWKMIKLTLGIVDGIDADGNYKGGVLFQTVCYYANPEYYDQSKPFFKNKQYLVQLKYLISAVGMSLDNVKIGDAFCEAITGKTILGSIVQVAETQKDESGQRVKTGEMLNEVKNFKAAPVSSMV